MLEQAIAAFVQEARDILAGLEDQLLQLEQAPEPHLVDAIFRGLHTIKGSGAMFGYTALARFTHHLENAYEHVRTGALAVDRGLIDLSLEASDRIGAFLDLGGDGPEAEALLDDQSTRDLIARIQALCGDDGASPASSRAEKPDKAPVRKTARTRFSILFRPDAGALINGMRPDLLVRELEALGHLDVVLDAVSLPPLEAFDPTQSYLGWRMTLVTDAPRSDVEDVFLFADDAELEIEEAPAETVAPADRTGPVPSAADRSPAGSPSRGEDTVRVASSRLDDMMDSIGELVIAQARLEAVSDRLGDGTLGTVVEDVARLVLGLRDTTLSIRMLPIETVFGKFRRVVRDLSGELGKEVRLETVGGETELDKTVIDRIGDPLVHMIRNSIDHGIESASAREAAGKSRQACVHLMARQEGGEILIALEDDGKGLDTDAIRTRAIERGLLADEADPTEAAIHQLVFEPGFSTAAQVTSVSGRGVGMDAVRSTIDALGGQVEISSSPGRGTRITLRLPVTMAIVDGLRVRLGESVFVVPLSSVEECVEMDATETKRASGRSVLEIRDQMVPWVALDQLFGLPADGSARRRVVVVRVDGQRVGLVVDDILGQGQTVIKPLSPYHRDIPGLGGATILGDGRVALIIDTATLVRWAEIRHAERRVA